MVTDSQYELVSESNCGYNTYSSSLESSIEDTDKEYRIRLRYRMPKENLEIMINSMNLQPFVSLIDVFDMVASNSSIFTEYLQNGIIYLELHEFIALQQFYYTRKVYELIERRKTTSKVLPDLM